MSAKPTPSPAPMDEHEDPVVRSLENAPLVSAEELSPEESAALAERLSAPRGSAIQTSAVLVGIAERAARDDA